MLSRFRFIIIILKQPHTIHVYTVFAYTMNLAVSELHMAAIHYSTSLFICVLLLSRSFLLSLSLSVADAVYPHFYYEQHESIHHSIYCKHNKYSTNIVSILFGAMKCIDCAHCTAQHSIYILRKWSLLSLSYFEAKG